MKREDESLWLRDRMQTLRKSRDASAPPFEQIWRATRAKRTSAKDRMRWSSWKLAGASAAAALVVAGVAMSSISARQHSRQMEREFATVDGALLTYWQAPSDDLLPVGNWNDSPEPP